MLVQIGIIIKCIYCFSISSNKNQTEKSENNTRQELFKKRIAEINVGYQTVAHNNSFTGNEAIVNTG